MNRERISIAWFWCLFVWPFAISAVQHPPDVNPASFTAGQAIDNAYVPQRVGTLFVMGYSPSDQKRYAKPIFKSLCHNLK